MSVSALLLHIHFIALCFSDTFSVYPCFNLYLSFSLPHSLLLSVSLSLSPPPFCPSLSLFLNRTLVICSPCVRIAINRLYKIVLKNIDFYLFARLCVKLFHDVYGVFISSHWAEAMMQTYGKKCWNENHRISFTGCLMLFWTCTFSLFHMIQYVEVVPTTTILSKCQNEGQGNFPPNFVVISF